MILPVIIIELLVELHDFFDFTVLCMAVAAQGMNRLMSEVWDTQLIDLIKTKDFFHPHRTMWRNI